MTRPGGFFYIRLDPMPTDDAVYMQLIKGKGDGGKDAKYRSSIGGCSLNTITPANGYAVRMLRAGRIVSRRA